jgi:3-deoxy-D-manno-octulosonic-acid transferase
VGEYEQALPVIEALKAGDAELPILLTFFSPSLGERLGIQRPAWCGAKDHVSALPPDRPRDVRRFLASLSNELGQPQVAWCALVKYEVWPELVSQLSLAEVPVHLFAAHVVERALPLRWWARTPRAAWRSLASIRVQDEASVTRLGPIQLHAEVSGDPRFDRVLAIADSAPDLAAVRSWIAGRPCIVAGSTWPAEEAALSRWWPGPAVALIVAPHEVDSDHLDAVTRSFGARVHRFSAPGPIEGDILLIDGIGWLSRLYAVADVAVVGGGFGKGIHNVLEPAAHGVPVLVGPQIHRFREAQALEAAGALLRIETPRELAPALDAWLADVPARHEAATAARAYAESGRGAAGQIANALEGAGSTEKF